MIIRNSTVACSWHAGSLFSLISATQVVSAVAAYVLYSLAYKTSLEMNWRAGTPFWLMAILYAISMPLLM